MRGKGLTLVRRLRHGWGAGLLVLTPLLAHCSRAPEAAVASPPPDAGLPLAAPQPPPSSVPAEAGSGPALWPFADAGSEEPTGPTPTTGRLIVHFSIRGHPEQSSAARGFGIDVWTDANERVYPGYDRALGWFFTLSPGHYRLGCNGPARHCDRDVRIAAGQTLEVSIER